MTDYSNVLIEGDAINSIGDLDIGIKYGITKPGSRFPVAVSVILGLPTGRIGGGSQNNLQTGDGEFNQMVQVDLGTSIKLHEKIERICERTHRI